jgi:hypothetical protein
MNPQQRMRDRSRPTLKAESPSIEKLALDVDQNRACPQIT